MGTESEQHIDLGKVPNVGEVIDDRYRLETVVATGGMGVIMRARQLPLDRDVAIKLLHPHIASDPETVRRFEREVDLAKHLNHPNAIQLFDFGRTEQGTLYIVMEMLEGRDLEELIDDAGPLTTGRTLEIARQTLDGLAEAHARDIVHRDLKPSNIFIEQDRRGSDLVKILDFGIARSLQQPSDLTGTNQVCGTSQYMAPEALLQRDVGKPGDLYAMGLIIAEMLIGERVFDAENVPQTILLQVDKPVPIPEPIADTEMEPVLRRATAKHPEDRFRDADEMLSALESAAESVPPDRRIDPEAIPSIRVPENSALLDQLADGIEERSMDLLERRPADSGDIVPKSANADTNSKRGSADTPTGDTRTRNRAPAGEPTPPPQPAPTPAPQTSVQRRPRTPSERRARTQKELVGRLSGTLNERLDSSWLWAGVGLLGIVVAVGVFLVVFVPEDAVDLDAVPLGPLRPVVAGSQSEDDPTGDRNENGAANSEPEDGASNEKSE